MPDKALVFISHITEEHALATAVRQLLEDTFPQIEVFQSSDTGFSLPGGTNRIDRITAALRECSAIVVLCSQESIGRPWIHFESGAGWVRDIPVIPLCHSNLSREQLPLPLSLLTSANASSADQVQVVLLQGIATAVGSRLRTSALADFITAARQFEADYGFASVVESGIKQLKAIVARAHTEAKSYGMTTGMLVCKVEDTQEVRELSRKLEAARVCRLIVRGTIQTGLFEANQILVEHLEKFDAPEVREWFGKTDAD